MTTLPKMMSYYHKYLNLSLRVPETWYGEMIHETMLHMFSPAEPKYGNYRSTISFQMGQPEEADEVWLAHVFQQHGERMQNTYHRFQLVHEENFVLSSLAPVYWRHYRWQDTETGLAFAQLQALILYNQQTLYIINSATLQPVEKKHLPIQQAIIRSTRIIPPRQSTG